MTTKKSKNSDTSDIQPGPRASQAPDGVLLVRRPSGQAVFEQPQTRAVRQATPAQKATMDNLQMIARTLQHANLMLREEVALARRTGLSWETIGWNLGITGQAVRKRFGE